MERMGTMKIPFNAMDEMFMHLDGPTRPLTVHLEVRVAGALDDDRVRTAVSDAVARHPLARARLLPWSSDAKAYEWLVDDELQLDPVRVTAIGPDGSIDDLRSEVSSTAITLFESPPFRLVLVHRPGGDHLVLAANHTGCDGIGALRLLQSVGRAYSRVPDPTT